MIAAQITALRERTCKVHAELGAALLALEDAESLIEAPASTSTALVHEQMDNAARAYESAAAHLADLVRDADHVAAAIAPKGVAP